MKSSNSRNQKNIPIYILHLFKFTSALPVIDIFFQIFNIEDSVTTLQKKKKIRTKG